MKAIYWAMTLVATGLLIPFALSNRELVSLGFWRLPFLVDLPPYVLVLLLLLAVFDISCRWGARSRLSADAQRLLSTLCGHSN